MLTKKCNKCLRILDKSNFHKRKINKDGYWNTCKNCRSLYQSNLRQTSLSAKAACMFADLNKRLSYQKEYYEQGISCKFTLEQFKNWAIPALKKFIEENPDERPSLDRKEVTGHYEFGNIQIISLSLNCKKDKVNYNAPKNYSWCNRCQQYLKLEKFSKNRTKSTGVQAYCKICKASSY